MKYIKRFIKKENGNVPMVGVYIGLAIILVAALALIILSMREKLGL